jgi:hypothetical protein
MPSRALLTESQTIPAADITQALANVGIARVSLSAPVTRTSTTTMTNDGLSALTVSLLPSSRYRLTYRLFDGQGSGGFKVGFTWPSSLLQFDGYATFQDSINGSGLYIYADFPNQGSGSGDPILDAPPDIAQNGGLIFIADIKTGSTVNTYGDFAVVFAQNTSNASPAIMSQNSCVEVLKFS